MLLRKQTVSVSLVHDVADGVRKRKNDDSTTIIRVFNMLRGTVEGIFFRFVELVLGEMLCMLIALATSDGNIMLRKVFLLCFIIHSFDYFSVGLCGE